MSARAGTSTAKIHPTAIVDPKAKLADGVEIGPFCVIGPDVTLGPDTRLHNNVTIMNRVTVGRKNEFYPYAVIGGKPQDLKYRGEDTDVVVGDHNTIREFATINIGTAHGGGVTRLGNHNLLMAGVHIAHDCELSNNIVIANNVLLAGHVKVEECVVMSAYVGLHHFVTVGKHAFIGGFARVNVDVPPFMLVEGIPMTVVSINTIGLRRRGFGREQTSALKDAHRLLWRSGLPKSEAIAILEQRYPHQTDIKYLIDFLRAVDCGRFGRAREALRTDGFFDPDEDLSADGQDGPSA
ncbi:MAG: acyl-ACP--UDP-N-acetylglucosamine O-acyltransferase [Planctomycetes bacterium]|nr:acyl-ACP--UDP-N-acetylglucosamine O-acyltransferase [Planctomycetota bacterium]